MGNIFIWSAFRFYLRQPTDSYVVYSPVKYWKAQHLINKKFLGGFAFNRRHFHTNIDACIMCALWANIEDAATKEIRLKGYDISDNFLIEYKEELPVKRISSMFSKVFYDKRKFDDDTNDGILIGGKGLEARDGVKKRAAPIYNSNIIGYLIAQNSGFDEPDLNSDICRCTKYNGNGFQLRKDNYLEKLPMFAASRYITYNREWTERARIMKSADGAKRYARDVKNGTLRQWLLKCLLFTCVEMQNHMRSFSGSDGRFYRNELCLDPTNGDTIALRDLKELTLGESENKIMEQWRTVLQHAAECADYNITLTYGVYQIFAELDTSHKDETTGATVYDNVELHSALQALKQLVREYYNTEIVPTLFCYEFLK